jgi:hypothetical protein
MADDMMEYLESQKPGRFIPRPFYGAKEDSLTFYFRDDESYAKRIDDTVTLFLAIDGDELVGVKIKGIKQRFKQLQGWGVQVAHGKIKLGVVLHLLAYDVPSAGQRDRYETWVEKTKNIDMELDELVPA